MDHVAPTLDEIEDLARETVANLPPAFREAAQAVALRVADFASDDILEELEMEPFDLTGLYDGIPMTEKSNWDVPHGPDTVWLFRRPILDEWAEGSEELEHLVTHVLIHEVGHHFGFSDEDMHALEEEAR